MTYAVTLPLPPFVTRQLFGVWPAVAAVPLTAGSEAVTFLATVSKPAALPSRRKEAACSVVLAIPSHPRTGGP